MTMLSRWFQLIFILAFLLSIVPVSAEWQDPCPMEAQDELTAVYLNDRSNYERKVCEYAAKGYCYKCNDPALSACNKYGISISCGPGPTVTQPPPESDYTWIVVIGVLVVAGVVGGAVVLTKKKPPAEAPVVQPRPKPKEVKTKEKEKEKEKEEIQYILQLSTDRLLVEPGKPANLMVTVWKQVGSQPPQQASEAAISLTLPAEAGLIMTPSSGRGQLSAQVRAGDATTSGEFPVTVTATVGNNTQEATVMVSIEPYYVMELY